MTVEVGGEYIKDPIRIIIEEPPELFQLLLAPFDLLGETARKGTMEGLVRVVYLSLDGTSSCSGHCSSLW